MTTTTNNTQSCLLVRFNHFDPLWRRCWDRSFMDAGLRYVSYRDIETAWLDDAIASTADGASCFLVEASWVLRHYLERRPEQQQLLRRLAKEGRFELLASGENIIDTNMVHGELLARNLALGILWGEDAIGVRPTTGWMSDDFGSSAQMPQIFRGCGVRWVPAISYCTPDAPYWRGLDGSTVFYEVKGKLPHKQGTGITIYRKHPPCGFCRGMGCEKCGHRGFDPGPRTEFSAPPKEKIPTASALVVMLWGEEILPGMNVAADVAAFNGRQQQITVRQGRYRDLEQYLETELAAVDNPPTASISSKVENNPSQTGCYVSRIKIKQQHRQAENALLTAEKLDTIFRSGASAVTLRDLWRKLTLGAFHDSLTCSHIDQAYDELMDMYSEIKHISKRAAFAAISNVVTHADSAVTVFNPQSFATSTTVKLRLPDACKNAAVFDHTGKSVPVHEVSEDKDGKSISFLAAQTPPLGFANFTFKPAEVRSEPLTDRTLKFDDFTLEAGEQGITAITHSQLGPIVNTKQFLVGEVVLETDVGDPWATRTLDRTRWRQSPFTKLHSVVKENDTLAITYHGRHPSTDNPHGCADPQVTLLTWTQVFRLRKGLPWIDVATTVHWYTQSRRLRLMFPSTTTKNDGIYDIPFGTIERPRYEGTSIRGGNAGGDWPALHWGGIAADNHVFAIFNAGTPSYRIEDGVVGVSVLRSPQIPYGLNEPQSYTAQNYHGMMDHGVHHFHHAIYAAKGTWQESDITRQAAAFNCANPVFEGKSTGIAPRWSLQAAHANIATIKPAEDGNGVVVRLSETIGKPERVTLIAPPQFTKAQLCNLLEDPQIELSRSSGGFSFDLKPWSIATVRFT